MDAVHLYPNHRAAGRRVQEPERSISPDNCGEIPGVSCREAIRAFGKAGFRIKRQSKHIVVPGGIPIITIPRTKEIIIFTMAVIVKDAGLTVESFKSLLWMEFSPLRGNALLKGCLVKSDLGCKRSKMAHFSDYYCSIVRLFASNNE